MSQQDSVTYTCPTCKYPNTWTRAEVISRGKKVLMRDIDGKYDEYSLPCKNPKSPACDGRYVVAVERRKE
jgi:hypothetical protein